MGKEVRKSISLTIDGHKVTVPEGTTVLVAAKKLDIEIPHYCYHPSLSIAGSCRLCLVEIEGIPKLALACSTPVQDGMIVRTDTEQVHDARRGMMEFLLINHPLDCPVCDRGGECMLHRYSMDHGFGHCRTTEPRRRFRKRQFDPLLDLERNRCVLCTRCIRFMEEIGGEHSIGIFERGDRSYIGTFEDGPVQSIFSGMIIDYCPVGSWTSKPFRFRARAWELQQVQSTCPYCASGCDVTLWIRAGRIHRVTPPTYPLKLNFQLDYDSRAIICNQGRFGCDFAHSADRLRHPTVKREGEAVEVEWDEALDEVASRLTTIREKHGPDSIGLIASSRATCEEMYLLQRLARDAIGTNNVDWRTAAADGGTARALSAALGWSTGQLNEPDRYDVILLVNTDLLAQAPVTALKVKEAARTNLAKVFVIDYRIDDFLSRHAHGIVHCSIENTERLLEGLERKTAVGLRPLVDSGQDALVELVHELQSAKRGLIVYGVNACSGLFAERWTARILHLAENVGADWELLPISAQRNATGGFVTGCQPDRLPGGWIDDAALRGRVRERWGSLAPKGKGYSAPEMLEAARAGRLKALYVLGASDFHARPWLDSILTACENLELLVVHDVFPSPLSERAQVVLPGALFFEKEGTLTDVSGWPARLSKGWPPPHGIQDDAVAIEVLARKMGKDFGYDDVGAVFEEMMQLINPICPGKAGDLCVEGPVGKSPIRCLNMPRARARVQEGKFYSICSTYVPSCRLIPGGELRSFEPASAPRASEPSSSKLRLVWSPILQGADVFGDRSEVMAPLRDPAWIEMHPDDAATLGIAEGDTVAIRADGVAASGRVRVTRCIARGLVYVPENSADLRFSAPPTDLPEVQVRKVEQQKEQSA